MIVLKTNVKNLLTKDLSVEERGLLITAMLCKESIPALTEAKFKVFVDTKKFRSELVSLHEKGFIKWAKYSYAKKAIEKIKVNPLVKESIDFMNNLYTRKFDHTSEGTTSGLIARLNDYSIEEIKLVVANRYEEWKDDNVMHKNLTPTTIFRKKLFEKYLEEANRTKKGSGIIKAVLVDLSDGDMLTYSNTQDFADSDLYSVKTYNTDINGNKVGNGKVEVHKGNVLKKMLNVQNNLKRMVQVPTKIYIFVKR